VGGHAQRRSERASSPSAKSHLPQSLRFAAECFGRPDQTCKTFGRKAASYGNCPVAPTAETRPSDENTAMQQPFGQTGAHQLGFTVLELLVALTIAAVVLAMVQPALQHFTWRQHMRAGLGNLHNDLLLARSEAVFRNVAVVACPGDPLVGCAGSSDWSQGWIVFPDLNGDRQHQAAEEVLRTGQVFENLAIVSSSGRSSIRFLPDGSSPGSNGTIGFCGAGGPALARKLVISNIGRIRRDLYPGIDASLCPQT